MDTRTGEIRELGPDEKPNEYETLLTRKERRRLELLTPIARKNASKRLRRGRLAG
jgi:hypothetical protein